MVELLKMNANGSRNLLHPHSYILIFVVDIFIFQPKLSLSSSWLYFNFPSLFFAWAFEWCIKENPFLQNNQSDFIGNKFFLIEYTPTDRETSITLELEKL
jgi:hypothetical protein